MDFSKLVIDGRFGEGEKSRVRRINWRNKDELNRLVEIEASPGVVEYVLELLEERAEFVRFSKGSQEQMSVAVVDRTDLLQGWLNFYEDEEERIERLQKEGHLKVEKGTQITEVSYAKYPGAESGLMSGGLRQMLKIFATKCQELDQKMLLTAYTDPRNLNSSRLLAACGFRKIGEIAYHPGAVVMDEVWVYFIK